MDNGKKQEFIDQIALRSAVNAATQTRSKKYHVFASTVTYQNGDSKEAKRLKWEKKKEVINVWKSKLKEYSKNYISDKRDDVYFFKDVKRLKRELSNKISELQVNERLGDRFEGGRIRIAQCQKSLSVYLKWLWCLDIIKYNPPVCPIDRNVLDICYKSLDNKNKDDKDRRALILKVNRDGGWGQIDDPKEYESLVGITALLAERSHISIAEWELSFFNMVLEEEDEEA